MRADASFAVPVKLWALLCVFAGVTIGGNVLLTCILTGGALLYLVLQRSFRLAASYGCFYLLLALLLYGIRFHGLRMPVFSEFYVLMFWNLSPIFLVSWDLITTPPGMLSAFLSRLRMPTPFILGLLVVFRFFPTMRTELKGEWPWTWRVYSPDCCGSWRTACGPHWPFCRFQNPFCRCGQ